MGTEPHYTPIPDDPESVYPIKQTAGSSRRKGRSCLRWTVIIVLVTFAFATLLAIVTGTCTYFWVKKEVIRLTTDEPNTDIPIHRIPDAELEVVKDRAKLFVDMLKAGQVPSEDLTMTVDEANGFIAHSDYLRGNFYFEISDGEVTANMSLPAKSLPGGKGRYFVASGFLDADKDVITTQVATTYNIDGVDAPFLHAEFKTYWEDDDKLVVNILSGKLMNWIVPQDYIDEKENLLEDMYDCDDATRIIKGIEGWSIENGKITVKARRSLSAKQESRPESTTATTKDSYGSAWNNHGTRLLRKMVF